MNTPSSTAAQRRRIGVQAIENLVKKYSQRDHDHQKDHPSQAAQHLRYGSCIQETGDIYLVADVLGHRDVNTTKKHYAALRRCQKTPGGEGSLAARGLIPAARNVLHYVRCYMCK